MEEEEELSPIMDLPTHLEEEEEEVRSHRQGFLKEVSVLQAQSRGSLKEVFVLLAQNQGSH